MDKNAFFLPQAEKKSSKDKERRPIGLHIMLGRIGWVLG
jgi:hypothetical protein